MEKEKVIKNAKKCTHMSPQNYKQRKLETNFYLGGGGSPLMKD